MAFDPARFRDLYPFANNWHTLPCGQRMHYLDEGQGDPVVCVHGNPTWSFFYRNIVTELRKTHRVIAPDHIGCGLSDKPPAGAYDYTLAQHVADLEALLEALGITRGVTLVVHDWGGMIGMGWAVRHVEAVARIVVLNTGAFLKPARMEVPWQLKFVRQAGPLAAVAVLGFNGFVRGTLAIGTKRRLDPHVRRGYLAPYDSWENRIATLRFVRDIPVDDRDSSFPTAKAIDEGLVLLADKPMFIGWGGRDFVFDQTFLDEWRSRFPSAELHLEPDAGHLVLEDAGWRLIPAIRRFVETDGSSGAE